MKASCREKVQKIIDEKKPRWVWVSYPCGPTSHIQHLNEISEEGCMVAKYETKTTSTKVGETWQ